MKVYATIREQLLDDTLVGNQPQAAREWVREVRCACCPQRTHPPCRGCSRGGVTLQMLDYNVPGGKLNRGMAVYDVLAACKGTDVRMC